MNNMYDLPQLMIQYNFFGADFYTTGRHSAYSYQFSEANLQESHDYQMVDISD